MFYDKYFDYTKDVYCSCPASRLFSFSLRGWRWGDWVSYNPGWPQNPQIVCLPTNQSPRGSQGTTSRNRFFSSGTRVFQESKSGHEAWQHGFTNSDNWTAPSPNVWSSCFPPECWACKHVLANPIYAVLGMNLRTSQMPSKPSTQVPSATSSIF